MQPVTKYIKSGDVHIAYQVIGEGPFDLIYVPGWVSHVELAWEEPTLARFLGRLASFCRLITFDKRGTGLSDRVPVDKLPTLNERMDDLKCVMEAVGSKEAALFGFSEGGNLCALFAHTYPERVRALVMFGVFAKRIWSAEYPWAPKPETRARQYEIVERNWGYEMDLENMVPSKIHDKEFIRRLSTYFRRAASPSAAVTLLRMNTQVDITGVLPSIQAPTLILHRTHDRDANVEEGRWIASRIPNARFVELSGEDHLPWVGDQDIVLDHTQEFLTGVKPEEDFDRVFATIMFTDIVGSTELAATMGDHDWRELLETHQVIVRRTLYEHKGEEIDTTGDGFLLAFDKPDSAINCAKSIITACADAGLDIRIGIHYGNVYKLGATLTGLAVHIAARVVDKAGPREIIITNAVKDLLADTIFTCESQGVTTLRGVPDEWHLYSIR